MVDEARLDSLAEQETAKPTVDAAEEQSQTSKKKLDDADDKLSGLLGD